MKKFDDIGEVVISFYRGFIVYMHLVHVYSMHIFLVLHLLRYLCKFSIGRQLRRVHVPSLLQVRASVS